MEDKFDILYIKDNEVHYKTKSNYDRRQQSKCAAVREIEQILKDNSGEDKEALYDLIIQARSKFAYDSRECHMILLRVLSQQEIILRSKVKGQEDSIVVVDTLAGEVKYRVINSIEEYLENKYKNERKVKISPLTVIADILNNIEVKDKRQNIVLFEVKDIIEAPAIDILNLQVAEIKVTKIHYTIEGLEHCISIELSKHQLKLNFDNDFILKDELKRIGVAIDVLYNGLLDIVITLDNFYSITTSYNEDKDLENKVLDLITRIHS